SQSSRKRAFHRILGCGGFHGSSGATGGRALPLTISGATGCRALPVPTCEIRQQIAEILTPKDSMIAPSATCAVAISAALFLQIIQAPSAIWQATNTTQIVESRFSATKSRAYLQTRRQNTTIAIATINARNLCTICNQI